jgi:plastocyanin
VSGLSRSTRFGLAVYAAGWLAGGGVAIAACANDSPTADEQRPQIVNLGAGTAGGDAAVVEAVIVGQELTFDVTRLEVSAGQDVTITFDNRDAGVLHNFHVTGPGDVDVVTEIEVGPVVQTITLALTEPGEYTYVCDVHPATMRGTIVVTA